MNKQLGGPVVVGIDGSEIAQAAAVYAGWEATRLSVPLKLVYAHQPIPMWGPVVVPINDYAWEQDWARDMLGNAAKAVAAGYPELTVESIVVSGGPAASLLAASRNASLVVLGTESAPGVTGHLAGSVAAQVAAHAQGPVIVVRDPVDPAAEPYASRRIVVGLDGSDESDRALAFAVDEAVARTVALEAVFVWTLADVHDNAPFVTEDYRLVAEAAKAERLLAEAVSGWCDRYPDLTIEHRLVHDTDPVESLCRAAADAGLIVVGSRGHGGFMNLRLGSTVDGLIRHARTPVAVVRGDYPDRR